jgi:hypothetical protein
LDDGIPGLDAPIHEELEVIKLADANTLRRVKRKQRNDDASPALEPNTLPLAFRWS